MYDLFFNWFYRFDFAYRSLLITIWIACLAFVFMCIHVQFLIRKWRKESKYNAKNGKE